MKRNIFVLLMDTARASDTYRREIMPNINRIAERGTRYTNAVSPGTWTAPTHASLFANSNVSSIKEVSQNFFKGGSKKIDPWMVRTKFINKDASTLAGKLSKEGYYSVLFSNNPFLTSNTNLAVGFDKTYDIWLESNVKYNKKIAERFSFALNGGASARSKIFKASYAISKLLPKSALDKIYLNLRVRMDNSVAKADGTHRLDRGASDTNRLLSKYLRYGYNYAPQFMFINYIEAHENYPVNDSKVQDKWRYLSGKEELNDSVKKEFHNAYLRRLRYLDKQIANTMKVLKSQGMLDSATVVLTSDHGQLFGEHGLLYHAMPPYEGLSKVPLISANYENGRIAPDNGVVEEPVSLLSLHNSILDLAKGRCGNLNGNIRSSKYVLSEHTGISEGWDEHLLSLLKPKSNTANQIYKAKTKHNRRATAVYKGKFKLIHFFGNKLDELYNLETDPHEASNIINYNRGMANAMLGAAV